MILVVGPFPNNENEKDGMLQRISAMDQILSIDERIYLDIRFARAFFQKEKFKNRVTIYKINFFLFFPLILYFAVRSRFIYVHTIINSVKILPIYPFKKIIITDLHGICPEEYQYIGRPLVSKIFSIVERVVFLFGKIFITVSHPMKDHFTSKYKCKKCIFFNIPIFQIEQIGHLPSAKVSGAVIYAGGMQRWQNIDEMISAIDEAPKDIQYTLLVSNPELMNSKIEAAGISKENIKVLSIPRSEIPKYYESANYGFVLRERNLVNRVACPTKLIEYMNYGIIPIVDEEEIGDFRTLGYSYLTVKDFIEGSFPNSEKAEWMKQNNYSVIQKLKEEQNSNLKKLSEYILNIVGKGDHLLAANQVSQMTNKSLSSVWSESPFINNRK